MSVDPGSFRDPLSRVHLVDGRVLRTVQAAGTADIKVALNSHFLANRIAVGDVIQTSIVDDESASAICPHDGLVVEHPRLDVWTYPYEWSFSMLRDAAILQLELVAEALTENLILKDSTPYNFQFVHGRPQFIDIGSFERYVDGEPWVGYRQFCQMFLYPLMLQAYADIDFQPLMRASIDGIDTSFANSMLSGARRLRKGVMLHVALLDRLENSLDDGKSDARSEAKAAGMNAQIITATVNSLMKIVKALTWKKAESEWSNYGSRSHYTEDDLEAKAAFVVEAAKRMPNRIAWDVGCNDGHFSALIAPHAEHVLAIDLDRLVVDMAYRVVGSDLPRNIVPVVADLVDPPPAIGWRNLERPAFLKRNSPDFVIALAVVHHMAITGTVPLSEIVDLFADLDARCVIEFPTRSDVMVKRLLRNKRGGLFDSYDLEPFEHELERRFNIERREVLLDGDRVMFEVTPK